MHFNTIVVGSGQAGVPFAARVAERGESVLLVERGPLGGTCINSGCTPTKIMIASARAAHVARTAGRLGVQTGRVRVDLPAVIERKNAMVEDWRGGIQRRLERAGDRLTLVRGSGRLDEGRSLTVNGEHYTADRILLDTGCRTLVPDIPGLSEVAWLDNARVMDLREVPQHLVIIGGGYIGCEFGQMFRRFGSRVTIVDHHDRLLVREDEDVSGAIEGAFREEGIELRLGVTVRRVMPRNTGVAVRLSAGRQLSGSHLLIATGRRPNTEDLGCETAGIELDQRGFIRVDERYRTTAAEIYAVGDVAGGPQFTHSSWDDHRILYDLLYREGTRTRADRIIPATVFTDPQVARVGASERALKTEGIACETATMPFGAIARANETDRRAGLLRVSIDPATERILGASIVGAEAGELIHVFVALMEAGAPARAIVDAEMVHPTFAEGLQGVLLRLPRYALR